MSAGAKSLRRYEIDDRLSSRIDFLRVIAMALVVLIHSYNAEIHIPGAAAMSAPAWLDFFRTLMHQVVTRSAIPMFFLISGVLLYSKQFTWRDNTRRKLTTILIPYLIWNTLWIAFYFVAQAIPQTAQYFTSDAAIIRQWDLRQWIDAYTAIDTADPFLYTFWFMKDLFILNLLAPVIRWLIDKLPLLCFSGLCILWFGNVPIPIIQYQSLVFFALGYYIVKYRLGTDRIDDIDIRMLAVIFAAAAVWNMNRLGNTVAHSIAVIAGVVLLIRISDHAVMSEKCRRFWKWGAGYVFFIYAFHEMTLTIFKKLFAKLLPQTAWVQLAEYLLLPVLVIALAIGVAAVLRRIMPRVYAVITGGRVPQAIKEK